MSYFPYGTRTALARAVATEIRALMAIERISTRDLAASAGFRSHNYVAIRLRDEKPFTLDDIELICAALGEEPKELLQRAVDNHVGRFWTQAQQETEDDLARRRREADEAEVSEGSPNLRAVANEGHIEGAGEFPEDD